MRPGTPFSGGGEPRKTSLTYQAATGLRSRRGSPAGESNRSRSDMTVPFYGAKVSPADVEAALACDLGLAHTINSFQMSRIDDAAGNPQLVVHLECLSGVAMPSDAAELRDRLYENLRRVNQDFREVTKMFGPEKLLVDVSPFGHGIFADRDIRVKFQYIA